MPDGTFEELMGRHKRGARERVEPLDIEVTEDGVALAFTETHGDTLLFDHDAGRWFEWQGDRWQSESTGRAFNYARELARDATNRLAPAAREKIRKSAFAAGVERFARCDPTHAVRQDHWDADPWLLGCPGVVVDLKTGKASDAKPSDRITRQTAVAPYLTARCPTWLAFLADATGGDQDLIRFLQQWCGYGLTGVTVEHALAFFYGPGGNGKSVFLNTIAGIMGDYAVTAAMETFTASKNDRHPTDLAMLKGARLVSASETEEGRAWAESRIKQMTGGDPISARFMRQDFFTFKPQFKLTVVGNHKPILHNVDDAAKRRFNIIPFTRKPTVPDRMLEEKLRAEWPGILRWMLEGCLDWQANGLVRPASVVEATAAYFGEQDLIGQWLEEKAIVEPGNLSRWENTSDLFASWTDYAKAAGENVGTSKGLAGKLIRHGLVPDSKRIAGKTYRVYLGVNLKRAETYHDAD
jgi:putative DNA primase/helicase